MTDSVYQRVLGSDIERLNPALRTYFSGNHGVGVGSGVFEVAGSRLRFLRPVLAYLHREREELYDLRHDPDEVINLANSPEHRSLLENLRKETAEFRARTDDFWSKNPLPSGERPDPAFA